MNTSDLIDGLDRLSITLSEMAMPTEAKLVLRARNHIAGPRDTSELEARLAAKYTINGGYVVKSNGSLVNPDGPEAAAALSTLRQRIEALEGALRRIEQLSPDVTHGWATQARNIARQALGEG